MLWFCDCNWYYYYEFMLLNNVCDMIEIFICCEWWIVVGILLMCDVFFFSEECQWVQVVLLLVELVICDCLQEEDDLFVILMVKEWEIVGMVCEGVSNKLIVCQLDILFLMVKMYLCNIFVKIEVVNCIELVF